MSVLHLLYCGASYAQVQRRILGQILVACSTPPKHEHQWASSSTILACLLDYYLGLLVFYRWKHIFKLMLDGAQVMPRCLRY